MAMLNHAADVTGQRRTTDIRWKFIYEDFREHLKFNEINVCMYIHTYT